MTYKKPEIIAKGEAKQSFVAGCPERVPVSSTGCTSANTKCMCGALR